MKILMLLLALGILPVAVFAQESQQEDAVRLFLDCQTDCDFDYLRREITFVSYVRDRTDSQVHLLITAQGTGSGGRRYILNFIGAREFDGVSDTLVYNTSPMDSDDTRRNGLARTIKMGLMKFIAGSPTAAGIRILYEPAEQPATSKAAVRRDPWNYWFFRVNGSGNAGGEALRSNYSFNAQLQANRTTEQWKFNFRVNARYSEQRTTLSDSTVSLFTTREYSSNSLLVKSLSDNLSLGGSFNANSSLFSNERIAVRMAPAIEYSLFPYRESSRRSLTLTYTVGVRRVEYRDTTIYLKIDETLSNQNLELSYGVQQPWGDIGFSINASSYFHDPSFNRLQINGGTDIRLFRGFSVNFGGDYSRIRDQLALRKEEASDEDLLLQRQQLRTNYRYGFNMGVSYSFGSIFNNVVNPRLN